MSWLVQRLLMETLRIKETHDIESDEYNNLLIVEKKMSEMLERDMFSGHEVQVLDLIREGLLFGDIESKIGIRSLTVSQIFRDACNKISFSLGGEFTNEGFVTDVSERYNLSEEEMDILGAFMVGNRRHKILRRPIKKTNE